MKAGETGLVGPPVLRPGEVSDNGAGVSRDDRGIGGTLSALPDGQFLLKGGFKRLELFRITFVLTLSSF